ncbi:Hypotetical protein [Gulosibacter molinativorax]|nr:Hypotetical protein [Gulosibacter molinativorax]
MQARIELVPGISLSNVSYGGPVNATEPKPLDRRLNLKADATLAFWPRQDALPTEIQAFAEDHEVAESLVAAGFVAAHVADRDAAAELLDNHLEELADVQAVWLIYAKGNRADINRDSLWTMLVERGWRPVSNISVNDVYSSIRIRPLKPGETGLHK